MSYEKLTKYDYVPNEELQESKSEIIIMIYQKMNY